MSSESRRRSTDDLLAKIDDVVSGHDTQQSTEQGYTMPPIKARSLDEYAYDEGEHMARLAAQLDAEYARPAESEARASYSTYQRLPGF